MSDCGRDAGLSSGAFHSTLGPQPQPPLSLLQGVCRQGRRGSCMLVRCSLVLLLTDRRLLLVAGWYNLTSAPVTGQWLSSASPNTRRSSNLLVVRSWSLSYVWICVVPFIWANRPCYQPLGRPRDRESLSARHTERTS